MPVAESTGGYPEISESIQLFDFQRDAFLLASCVRDLPQQVQRNRFCPARVKPCLITFA
jgi:hypothetical protein